MPSFQSRLALRACASHTWLFRLDPYHLTPTEGEEELVGKLEKRAVALKKRIEAEQTEKSLAEILTIQKALLGDLETAGIFSRAYSKQKQLWLEISRSHTVAARS